MAKVQNKVWCEVLASKHFNSVPMGETPCFEPAKLVGRALTVSYATITNDMKRQHIKLNFLIDNVADNKAMTNLIGYSMSPSYLKRLIKRSADKIDESFTVTTKDNVVLRIKPSIYLRNKTKTSVLKALRNMLKDDLKKIALENEYDNLVSSVLNYELQKSVKSDLKKVHPIASVEVRFFKKQ